MAGGKTLTIIDVLRWLMPDGTRPDGATVADWSECPLWPPDVFGVATYLAERSGCYALPGIVLSRTNEESKSKKERALSAQQVGLTWSRDYRWNGPAELPERVRSQWTILVDSSNRSVVSEEDTIEEWHRAVMVLLATADEACAGLGFHPGIESRAGDLALEAIDSFFIPAQAAQLSAQQSHSLAKAVDPDRVCVMPKALTPPTGCTLRSLSHHVALLPVLGQVKSNWVMTLGAEDGNGMAQSRELNLLLVPFPFRIFASDFVQGTSPSNEAAGYFTLRQGWLDTGPTGKPVIEELFELVDGLLGAAAREAGEVHEVIFPEAALTPELVRELASRLAGCHPRLEWVVAGAMESAGVVSGGKAENVAVAIELRQGQVVAEIIQRKHHRWRLERSQIETYGLGQQLDPMNPLWEEIDVHSREIWFALNRRNWVQAFLICEDLARMDPVLPVVNAVGPNLVLALLLDGPQLVGRWPGRYATVLAEDPGSAVLTLTAAGMVDRARPLGVPHRRVIGLWKDPFRGAVELELPTDAQALVLTLKSEDREQWTMDRRSDLGVTTHLSLRYARPVRLESVSPWIERPAYRPDTSGGVPPSA